MTQFETQSGERFADFDLPEGCMMCGGAVSIRATPAGAHGYCAHCHVLSRPQMKVKPNGVELSFETTALA